ncbi:MAG: hypothetical protein WEC84_00995 [Candidatus Andersenbacteria bacterium]
MPFEPDDIFEAWVKRLVPIWGPFYAMFYIIRLLWRETFRKQ